MSAREDVRFRSGEAECAAWLYRPDASTADSGSACVVLAHGFGGTREARLDAYAERFCAAGHTALVFDYRHFGASGGEPRQLIDIRRQHADWRAAIAYARGIEGVDPERIAVWGSSYSGGHVIAMAAGDQRLAAVIAQAPHTDGLATLRAAGLADLTKLTLAGLRDQAGALIGRDPHLIALVAAPGTLAAMNSPGALSGYQALFPPDQPMRNEFAARAALRIAFYSPLRSAARVRCPLLVQICSDDVVTPPAPARQVAERAPRGELLEYPGGHFDLYVGELFERAVADQVSFIERALAVRPAGSAPRSEGPDDRRASSAVADMAYRTSL